MIFKRELTYMEIQDKFPHLIAMKAEIEAAGAEVFLRMFADQEIDERDITLSAEGRCSKCGSRVVEVAWTGKGTFVAKGMGTKMEFNGLACPECKRILEYAGVTSGPFDLAQLLGL